MRNAWNNFCLSRRYGFPLAWSLRMALRRPTPEMLRMRADYVTATTRSSKD